MLTLKFGGTSMGSAQRILNSTEIMCTRATTDRISVVVSAVAGISNKLQESINACTAGDQPQSFVEEIRKIHTDICNEIQASLPGFKTENVMNMSSMFEGCSSLNSLKIENFNTSKTYPCLTVSGKKNCKISSITCKTQEQCYCISITSA